ncbi:uncharacterized protein LY89DRAFT_19567 [Mollisia scopiformis]|uniref:Uncharacterized protein n=1 Tax=Mollisia scopiformis TaxID=149040 RepID=A0A194XW55_MOLSC|nr:uncharacterized protein LY89DRAFT_19567 [Mollisia scopiformis]KUJ24366.1 hypothetical protein LY89DRAFT_19567 [Mollisia scopiformis]
MFQFLSAFFHRYSLTALLQLFGAILPWLTLKLLNITKCTNIMGSLLMREQSILHFTRSLLFRVPKSCAF